MRLSFWDILASMVMLAGLALATIFINIFVNPYTFINPFPPPTPVSALNVPTLTPSPRSLPDVWTATPESMTSATARTFAPSQTPSATSTGFILPSRTFTPTLTVSPSPSKSVTNTPNRTLTAAAVKTATKTSVSPSNTPVTPTSTQTPCSTTAGYCDDDNPSIVYTGTWLKYSGSGPYANTTHYSSTVGSTASFTFTGTRIIYVFPTFYNRGLAKITIDSVDVALISLYSPGLVWQQMWDSGTLSSGSHTIKITVMSDTVDLDAFIVNWGGPALTATPPKIATTTTINSDIPDPSVVGQSYTVTVTVTGGGDINGSVLISDGTGGSCSITLVAATGSCSLSSSTVGAKTLTADYSGNATYAASTGTASHTVNKADPVVSSWPTATAITYGQTLAASTLSGGVVSPAGTFAFTTPGTTPNAGTNAQNVTFTPTDSTNYNSVTGPVNVTVNKADPSITVWPTASNITYGQTLADSSFSGGTYTPAGSFTFTNPALAPNAGTANYDVIFTPTDSANYNSTVGSVSVITNKANQTIMFTSSAPVSATVGGPTYAVSATADSGLSVTITIDSGSSAVCSIVGNVVSFIGAGTCTINADQAGNSNYNAAPQEQQTIPVT